MKKQILSLVVALVIGTTVCVAQDRPNRGNGDRNGREQRIEKMVTELGLDEKQAKEFKAAFEEMKPSRATNNGERPSREEMQKKREAAEAKIKSILTEEQYKKYQALKENEKNNDKNNKGKKEGNGKSK